MKVLVIGGGGREHALAWKLAASPRVTALYVLPGNAGTAQLADNVNVSADDFDGILKFIRRNPIDLAVIGPEDPLARGLADRLRAQKIAVFGPSAEAARIEADKWFAKELMRHQAIPTAEAHSFTEAAAAEDYVSRHDGPLVIKAAGLAKGKGVSVCDNAAQALAAVDAIMRKKTFGPAGARVVIEERLQGPECSIMALVDRHSIYVMESAQDHKHIGDGDTGPMTGGMGAYSPTPVVTDAILAEVERNILVPAVDALARMGIAYQGVLYAGIMLTMSGPKVLEFNCRFGDPETQPLLMRLTSDLAEVLMAVAHGKLEEVQLSWDPRPAISVVAASKGYPASSTSGVPITGIAAADALPDVKVFHGGTKLQGDTVLTDGGRVLAVTALGQNINDARRRAYAALDLIHFDGMQFRRDIGHQALRA